MIHSPMVRRWNCETVMQSLPCRLSSWWGIETTWQQISWVPLKNLTGDPPSHNFLAKIIAQTYVIKWVMYVLDDERVRCFEKHPSLGEDHQFGGSEDFKHWQFWTVRLGKPVIQDRHPVSTEEPLMKIGTAKSNETCSWPSLTTKHLYRWYSTPWHRLRKMH